MTARGEDALHQAAASATYASGMCLRWVRERYDIGPKNGRAIDAWYDLSSTQRVKNLNGARGYPFFWYKAGRPGHIAVCIGGGRVRSTDWPRSGRVGNAYIRDISRQWGMIPLGYGRALNDVSVVSPTVDLSSIVHAARYHTTYSQVSVVESALYHRGYLAKARLNDTWTKETTDAYAKWQHHLGYTGSAANGIPGMTSLRRLAQLDPNFIVVP